MRVTASAGDFRVKAIAGTHTVLIALDCAEARRHGLLGFAFKRQVKDSGQPARWLRSQKVFRSIEPDPKNARDPDDPQKRKRFYTSDHPIQSFLWGDYAARPDTEYVFTILPMYGRPGALEPGGEIDFTIRTEKEFDQGHGVWFNRGAIAGQKFAEEFGNKPPGDIENPKDREVQWLSRGLLEACLGFIDGTPSGDGLRVAAYEFTYAPVLNALKAARDRGVDVRIVYHDSTAETDEPNETAMAKAGLPLDDQKVTFRRSKTKIPHNKFIVRLAGGRDPVEVWTGSTNFTPSGFLGQTNVGHRVGDRATAAQYLAYWEILKTDPERDEARAAVLKLTPDPDALIAPKAIVRVFSPRAKADLLAWYADRMEDATGTLMFTAAFGVAQQLVPTIAMKRDMLRFVLMEKPATDALKAEFGKDRSIVLSYGVPLGELYRFKDGKPVARKPIEEFELDKWFLEEEHFRPKNEGFVFFVHTKFLLIDPLSDDPLVCSGSANFSSNSLLQNDENMLLIRGDTRVADIYMTEFDRIFRHFYFRNIANELAASDGGGEAKSAFLDETDSWTNGYFGIGFKARRRRMFFATPPRSWVENAGDRAATKKKEPEKPAKKKVVKKKAVKKKVVRKKTSRKAAPKKAAAKRAAARRKTAKARPKARKTAAKRKARSGTPKRRTARR